MHGVPEMFGFVLLVSMVGAFLVALFAGTKPVPSALIVAAALSVVGIALLVGSGLTLFEIVVISGLGLAALSVGAAGSLVGAGIGIWI